ncbi:putative ribosome-binding factor A, mitochondrial [Plutella xylostella]|uniref:putative ribosome-binding factor A, mitochondrial n=1 Tax=Plutella xylostella TaxID=51655 RepID=UPI00203276DE|nr:putative ribosome-binding factor A, mitochondrial [Plutella xylostella]
MSYKVVFQKPIHATVLNRFYHVTATNCSSKKLGAKLCKMLNPSAKRSWYPSFTDMNTLPSVKSLTKVKHEPSKQGNRRIAVLNKLFMKHITDLMSSGSSSVDIVGRGIEISKVKISPDLQRVNIFWVCKGDTSDEDTEALLSRMAGPIRHELSTLRLMGEVPYIVFVKDRLEAQIVDLDRRLARADFGEDYAPTELGHLLKTDFTLATKLSPEMKAKIKQLEDEMPIEEEPIPEMTHNVFGLEHDKIMNRLVAARRKSKEAWSNVDLDNNVIKYRAPAEKSPEVDTKSQKQDLAEFLHKRQIQQNKIHKEMRDARALQAIQLNDRNEQPDDEDDDMDYEEEDDDSFIYTGNLGNGNDLWNKKSAQ